jgi:acetyl-CoA synthetase
MPGDDRMIRPAANFAEVEAAFRWRIPARYNIAVDVCDRHPDDALALIHLDADGSAHEHSFGWFRRWSNRLANALAANGIERGDRVGILLPQSPETALAHLAVYKLGAIAMPLFTLFGEDALEYRLANSEAKALVTDTANLPKLQPIRERLPALALVLVTSPVPAAHPGGALDLWRTMEAASDSFTPVDTAADDPALLIYTSGTTGPPKGALHAHRVLLGHMPGVELPHSFFPQPGDRFWTPADWAWAGGLLDVLLPAWRHGVPVVSGRSGRFDPEAAFELMARHGVRNTFLPPTALKMMREVPSPRERFGHALRSVGTGGESMGTELLDWGRAAFGLDIHEFYGQTECNLVVGTCSILSPVRPGWMGRAIPGHRVAVVGEDGAPLPPGTEGEIAVEAPDPVMFLEYWRNPQATRDKYRAGRLLTGDHGVADEDGWLRFVGRGDDVITSAGYRIGPGEIEDCLTGHPDVALAAAVGVPDPLRTEVVKAFVVLREGRTPSADLEASIRDHVRTRLAAHEYPRLIEFVGSLPTTATGKIRRRDLRQREIERQHAAEKGAEP